MHCYAVLLRSDGEACDVSIVHRKPLLHELVLVGIVGQQWGEDRRAGSIIQRGSRVGGR